MTLDEGAPSAQLQGTMFPEFNGTEWPHHVLSLGQGSDGKNNILFMRINNNLYTYEGKKIESVKCNLRLCIVPPISEEQASTVGITPPTPGPSGGTPALQEQIADAPVVPTPASGVGSTPASALINHVAAQLHEAQPASEQCPGPSSQAQSSTRTQPPHKVKGAKPSGEKSRDIPKLPLNAPSLDSPIKVWRDFIDRKQKHPHWGKDSKSMLMAMLPAVLGTSSRLDDSDAEADPPSLKNVQGFLLYECLAPVPP
ncbi:hypothetical protein BKA82DRAFT_4356085 [Pisolithus tinctorius]|nr:hypothetical protein BKA82DRAFT_4356085 [Pisolithus tinctorius]